VALHRRALHPIHEEFLDEKCFLCMPDMNVQLLIHEQYESLHRSYPLKAQAACWPISKLANFSGAAPLPDGLAAVGCKIRHAVRMAGAGGRRWRQAV
jgi:hypothetical protein